MSTIPNLISPHLRQQISNFSKSYWTMIPSYDKGNMKAGIVGSIIGSLAAFVLPSLIPPAIPIIGGAYLGVQARKTIQQQGKDSLYQRALNWVSETSETHWNKISKTTQAGLVGAAVAGVIGPFILPRFVPSVVFIPACAYLGVQLYKKIGH